MSERMVVSFREWNEAMLADLRREITLLREKIAKLEAPGPEHPLKPHLHSGAKAFYRGAMDRCRLDLAIHEDEAAARAQYDRLCELLAAKKAAA